MTSHHNPSPTYTALAALRTKLQTTKIKERRQASKELLEKLSDPSTLRQLEWEAQCGFDNDARRNSRGGGGGGEPLTFPRERVSILLRNLLDAAILSSSRSISGETAGSSGRQKKTANGTGFIKHSCKFTAEDVLFPYKVFLRVDGPGLEHADGGYGVGLSWEEDWKSKPRYGFHLDTEPAGLRSGSFNATYYRSHDYSDDDRGTRLSSKEVLSTVNYCISCLNDNDCCDQAEVELMEWLAHICARPDYVALIPVQSELSYILHEISTRLYREFEDGRKARSSGSFAALSLPNSSASRRSKSPIKQECLLACAKCLSGLVYNCTTRLGIGMQLYLRPIVEMVGWWAENAWNVQSGGGMTTTGIASTQSAYRSNLRSETDIFSLLPYLYSSVTHLVAAHPEQSVAVISERGHALLRMARKNYLKSATYPQMRDALTEYISAHLLVAETSGRLHGLPEGDVGPLVVYSGSDEDDKDANDKVSLGATLNKKAIDSLLEMVRNEKVWESLFLSPGGEHDALAKKNKALQRRHSLSRKKRKRNTRAISVEGGGTWAPLSRKQRRYLELEARLLRLSQRLHIAEAEALGDGSSDALESLIIEAEKMTQNRSDIENGEIDIDSGFNSTSFFSDGDSRHVASDEALAGTPWVRIVCQHLNKLNPKLEETALAKDAPPTKITLETTQTCGGERDLFTQRINFGEESSGSTYADVHLSHIKWLLGSCPILRALVTKNAHATTDLICPSTIATLQLICASAESFPRGECWSSSTRRHWSTTLDESEYPGGASARVRERNGSSPADAASVVYLLGTTLESYGGSSGDDDVQMWALMALLKMTESTAVICSREEVSMSPEPLSVAWQYVWRVLFRYDLRYSSYTAAAYANNAGELVLRLLTQILRYQCISQSNLPQVASVCSPFVKAQSKDIWKLPVFDKPLTVLTGACFELMTSVIQCTNVLESAEVTFDSSTILPDFSSAVYATRDRKWLVSFCLNFIENSLIEDNAHSKVQRSFLPFVATCLASLISGGDIGGKASSFELNNLTTYSVTEDTQPCIGRGPENDALDYDASMNKIRDMLWKKTVFPFIRPADRSLRSEQRISQRRGAVLNLYSDAIQERITVSSIMKIDSAHFVHKRVLGDISFEKIKLLLDELLFGLRYGSDGEEESAEEELVSDRKKAIQAPRVTGCLLLLLTIVLSSNVTLHDAAKHIADIATATIIRALDHVSEVLKDLRLEPPDVLATINHLEGIVTVLTHIVAAGGETTQLPTLFADQLKAIFSTCKGMLRNFRNSMYTSTLSPTETIISEQRRRPEYDSDDDGRTSQIPIQRLTQNARLSDESDGFMEDDADAGPIRHEFRAPLKRNLPTPKRRRIENTSISGKQDRSFATKSIDCQGAWACASLMILINPSMVCLEMITGHLVWPEDCDNQNGYSPVSKSLDPSGAFVCASLITQKLVIQRQHLRSDLSKDEDDQQSAIVLCIEVIFQARRFSPPSSEYFMWGLGILSDLIELGDRSEGCPSICETESKFVADLLYPEGVNQDNQDYRMIRQLKKTLKFRSLYRAGSLYVSTCLFLRGQENLHQALDAIFVDHFIKSSFRNIDEGIRLLACDALGVALGGFPDQKMIVSEMYRNILPPLKSEKKFGKWVNSLVDPKMPVELSPLEQSALSDARLSIEYHAIDCIGLIVGSTTDEDVCIDMVWKLIDLNVCEPAMALLCHRAFERAALMLGFNNVSDFFSDLAPHLLVKWIESRRSLREFPLLLTAPFALRGTCRYLPSEVLDVIVLEGGFDDRFWNVGDAFVRNFIQSFADFLIPIILLTESNETPARDDPINTSQYISDFTEILIESTSDESFAKILRHHICDIYSFIFVLRSDTNHEVHNLCDNAYSHLTRRISETHIQRDGAKQAFMILRRILKMHAIGIPLVGQNQVHLTPTKFIEGIKSVCKHITKSSNIAFLESAGSSMTELFIVSGFWLSSSGTSVRQREKFWKPISLLCNILQDYLREATIAPQEVCFCIRFFITIVLDPANQVICPSILVSLKEILCTLFFDTGDKSLAGEITATIHKLCLALLTVHRRSFLDFWSKCNSSLLSMKYNRRCSLGLVATNRDAGLWDSESNSTAAFEGSVLNELVLSKANFDEKTSSEIMEGAYDCLEIIVNNGKILLEDILGAEDIFHHQEASSVFGNVNKKYEVDSLFNSIRRPEKRSLLDECKHFIEIMVQYPISVKGGSLSTVSKHARLLALQRLAKSIEINHDSVDEIDISNQVLESLVDVCQSQDSNEAKVISTRCLGALKSCWISRPSHFDDEPYKHTALDDQLKAMKANALSMIGHFLLCDCPDVSLIAMKTAKSLLSLTDGKECWKLIDDEQTKGLLVYVNPSCLQNEQVVLSPNYLDRLKMIGASSQLDETPWCWNDGLWSCYTDVGADSTGNRWIKNVVCAMISCCLSNEARNPDRDFIYACQGLCAKEASFAACVFPGIIFYLLESVSRVQYEGSKTSIRDMILFETAIGSPTSNMNAAITNCFSRILRTCHDSGDSLAAPYAVTVVLDTLERLHSVTKKRFLTSTSHVRNCTDVPKNCSKTNTHEPPLPPKWRGVPYGVVLRLDGLDVAKACLRSKKYYSALYFCEMAMQNFSGVGNFFEQIASDSIAISDEAFIGDISGFGIEQEQERSILDLALIAKDIIVCCLSELQQKDELQGVLSQCSALSLKQNISTLKSVHECHNEETFPLLLDLDIALQTRVDTFDTEASRDVVKVTTCLEDLGLEHIKQHYLRGIGLINNLPLHEKWFEDALHKTCQWDEALLQLPDDGTLVSLSADSIASTRRRASLPHDFVSTSTGPPNYYEAVYQTLQRFVKEDISGGYSAIAQARQIVLNDISLLEGSESKLKSMSTHLSKLNVLGSLTLTGATMEGKVSLQDVLKKWGYDSGIKDLRSLLLSIDDTSRDITEQRATASSATFRLLRLDFSVKEVLLKILLKMFPQDRETISQAITTHVYTSCRIYRDLGRPDAAKQMSRLRSLLEVFQNSGMSMQSSSTGVLPLLLRLEDAKIMSRQCEFDEAIIHCKTIVNYLSSAGSLDTDFTSLLARTLLLGGCLMAHEHVDAVAVIESFFDRAAKLSHQAHRKSPHSSSLIQATAAYFKLGEFASSIYSSIEFRVSSEAWKQRKANLSEMVKDVASLEVERANLEKKYKRSKKQVDIDAFNAAHMKLSTLTKEIDLEGREIKGSQASLNKYLKMALESYCNALKLCPTTSASIDCSKHVFQLIRLWFKNCHRPDTESVVNDLLKSNLYQIPSYFFVPLAYQIFSRIDENDSFFQNTLRGLVIKICTEHPYHGISQLIALSNGNLTNKVEAARRVIQQLQKDAPEHVVSLIDTYKSLMDAYIDLAKLNTHDIPKKQTKGFTFSKYKLKLDVCLSGGRRGSKSLSLANAPTIITKPPSVRPDMQYGNSSDDPIGTERVLGFESTFELAPSGLHRPAIVVCLGSQGGRFKQLVKGEDDMRQDAIMQQVFGTMNNLLKREDVRGAESFHIITYGITPLSPTAGVLEWVNDTDSFGTFMTGSSKNVGALSKYYPGEWGNSACQKFYANGHEHKSQEQRRRDFDIICQNISPVFRFFFIEKFSYSMEAWHSARTAYTRSCAVNSIGKFVASHFMVLNSEYL
eukprot:CCRYP_009970-RE/>CCRYP_009970-RE protein AED:0.07 eAED:0.07 QI:22/1/1/1/1/0.88/9/1092/3640